MQVRRRIVVNQSIDSVWQVVAIDFDKIGDIITAVNSSALDHTIQPLVEGAPAGGRVCSTDNLGEIKEIITRFDERKKLLSYQADVSGLPKFVKNLENNWSLNSLGDNKTEIKMRIEGNLAGIGVLMTPVMKVWLGKIGQKTLEEVKYYAETGKIHPRKVEALQKVGRSPAAA